MKQNNEFNQCQKNDAAMSTIAQLRQERMANIAFALLAFSSNKVIH